MSRTSPLATTIATTLGTTLAVLLSVMAPSLLMAPLASSEPFDPVEVHIEAFSDGSENVTGHVSRLDHLALEVDVPAGAEVLSASLVVERERFEVTSIPLNATPRSLWCGDLDNDGTQDDVLVAMPEGDRVDWLALSGDPPVAEHVLSLPVPQPTSLAVDDLDRDRDLDLMVTSSADDTLHIFEATGHGVFALPVNVSVGARPGGVASQDIDPDFRRDVVVANSGGSSVTVLRGRGDLTYYPQWLELGSGPSALRLADLDRDLDVDLVVAESRNDTVALWYNVGNGNFTNATALQTGEGPVDIDVRDVNGDSLVDVVVVCSGSDELWVYRQDWDGSFQPWEVLPAGRAPRAVVSVQLNRDEDLNRDLVVASSGSDNLTAYLADGSLNHTIDVEIEMPGRPVDLGMLRAGSSSGHGDSLVVVCQMPPSLAVARSLPVAELLRLGFGMGGDTDKTELPAGTDRAVLDVTDAFAAYVRRNSAGGVTGNLTVHMEAWSELEGWLTVSGLEVWAIPNRPPRAEAGNDLEAQTGEELRLDASASYDPEGGALEFEWRLPVSGGVTLTGEVVRYVWSESGTYTVLLLAKDPGGLWDQDALTVTVNSPPTARGVVPDTVTAWEEVTLSAHLSDDLDGSIVDYIWDYGQGVVHGRQVGVVFTGSGDVTVTLEVVDDTGARTTAAFQVEVLPSEGKRAPDGEYEPEGRGEVPAAGAALTLAGLALMGLARGRRRKGQGPNHR